MSKNIEVMSECVFRRFLESYEIVDCHIVSSREITFRLFKTVEDEEDFEDSIEPTERFLRWAPDLQAADEGFGLVDAFSAPDPFLMFYDKNNGRLLGTTRGAVVGQAEGANIGRDEITKSRARAQSTLGDVRYVCGTDARVIRRPSPDAPWEDMSPPPLQPAKTTVLEDVGNLLALRKIQKKARKANKDNPMAALQGAVVEEGLRKLVDSMHAEAGLPIEIDFNGIAAVSCNEIYVGGTRGLLFRFDGEVWRQTQTDLREIKAIVASPNGDVFVMGRAMEFGGPTILTGRFDQWVPVEDATHLYEHMFWMNNGLVLKTSRELSQLRDGRLAPFVPTLPETFPYKGRLRFKEGVLVLFGSSSVQLYDGSAWTVLVRFYPPEGWDKNAVAPLVAGLQDILNSLDKKADQ